MMILRMTMSIVVEIIRIIKVVMIMTIMMITKILIMGILITWLMFIE